jgi:hypothetical protein
VPVARCGTVATGSAVAAVDAVADGDGVPVPCGDTL